MLMLYISLRNRRKSEHLRLRLKNDQLIIGYIDQMKKERVTVELAIKAFAGRFGGNESRIKFFLNADFYYGSDAPTPLARLIRAFEDDTISECIEMIEGTKISWYQGVHFL